MRIELPSGKKERGRIINNLAVSMRHAEMKISSDIRDKKSLHKEMLGKAVLAARNNAGILTMAAGVRRGPVVPVEYGWSEVRFRSALPGRQGHYRNHDR
jgi:hypothetical protein